MKRTKKLDIVTLNASERLELHHNLQVIQEGLATVFGVARALLNIKRKKLYRETHRTFGAFCREHLQVSRSHAYRLLDTAQAHESISSLPNVKLPEKESHLRPLLRLPAKEIPKVWKELSEQAKGSGVKLKEVEAFVASYQRKRGRTKCAPKEFWKSSVAASWKKIEKHLEKGEISEILREIEAIKLLVEHVGGGWIGEGSKRGIAVKNIFGFADTQQAE